MKTTITSISLALCLALGASTPALADRGHDRGYYRPAPQYNHGHYRPHHDHGHRRGYGWAGPAAVLAITGIAAGIAASNYYAPAPAPVYVAPPQPVYSAPLAGYWNYCASAGQYYPYVNYCPEGWQPVAPR